MTLFSSILCLWSSYTNCKSQSLLQVLIKPSHSLAKRLLFGKPLPRLRQVAAHREPMLHIGEQVNLVRNVHLIQDLLALMAFGSCKDKVPSLDKLAHAQHQPEKSTHLQPQY